MFAFEICIFSDNFWSMQYVLLQYSIKVSAEKSLWRNSFLIFDLRWLDTLQSFSHRGAGIILLCAWLRVNIVCETKTQNSFSTFAKHFVFSQLAPSKLCTRIVNSLILQTEKNSDRAKCRHANLDQLKNELVMYPKILHINRYILAKCNNAINLKNLSYDT